MSGNNASSHQGSTYLRHSDNNTLTGKTAVLNFLQGICLDSSNNNTLIRNTANSNDYAGIRLYDSNYNMLSGNNASNTKYYDGIFIEGGGNNILIGNNVSTNIYGIYILGSSYNTLSSNNVSNNNDSGIFLEGGSNNILIGNNVTKNDYGIYMYYSSYNTLGGNRVELNALNGIHISDVFSFKNIIYNNYFNNSHNAYDYGNNIWNITKTSGANIIGGSWLGGNYWHDYAGEDIDGDGLGNTLLPYNSSGDIKNGGDYLPLKNSEPSILIYTDKSSYSTGDEMYVGLNIINHGMTRKVRIDIWIDLPDGKQKMVKSYPSVTLHKGFDWKMYPWMYITLPGIQPGSYSWHAVLKNTDSGSIISESISQWAFGSMANAESRVEIGTILEGYPENLISPDDPAFR